MKKDEFLSILNRKLQVINERERQDIIDEYRMHIEMKMQEGKSEEEAIEDFGNIDELVNDILDAYKINTERVHNNFDNKFNHFMDELFEGFKRFIGSFTSLEIDDVVKLVFEIIIILVLLALLHIPFNIIESIGSSILHSIIGFGIGTLLAGIWSVIINVAYLVIFVVVLVNLCTKRVRRYRNSSKSDAGSVFDDFKESFDFEKAKESVHNFTNGKTKEYTSYHDEHDETIYKKEETQEDVIYEQSVEDDFGEKEEAFDRRSRNEYRYKQPYTNTRDSYDSGINGVLSILMKIFGCLLSLPFVFTLIGLCCALGAMVVLSFEGLTLVGGYFIVIGAISIVSAFLSLIYRCLWKGGRNL